MFVVLLSDYIKRGRNIDVFHKATGVWYVGNIHRLLDKEVRSLLNVAYPHFEGEELFYEASKHIIICIL